MFHDQLLWELQLFVLPLDVMAWPLFLCTELVRVAVRIALCVVLLAEERSELNVLCQMGWRKFTRAVLHKHFRGT